jgi:hypothetical protein
MSIIALVTLVESVRNKWKSNVVQGRPSEQGQLQAHLGGSTNYSSIAQQLDDWHTSLKALSGKPRVSASISKPLIRAATQCFSSLTTTLDHAGNGVEWMCIQRNLAVNFTLAEVLVRDITSDHRREADAMVDAAQKRLENDLAALQRGGAIAESLTANHDQISNQIKTLDSAAALVDGQVSEMQKSTDEARENVATLVEKFIALKDEKTQEIDSSLLQYKELLGNARSVLNEAELMKTQAQLMLDTAIKASADAEKKHDHAQTQLTDATEKQTATYQRLTKALQSAQMEGLAGSFTTKAEEARNDINKEQKRFEGALLYLSAVGICGLLIELSTGFPKTTEEFFFRLVRTISLAAPGIWVAWAAARKLSALNRVFSDYQYKSASALAYESYRQTVAEAGDDELKRQLLAFAIRSFGENPTRYFDSAKDDPSSPTDSFFSHLLPWKKTIPPNIQSPNRNN